MKKFPFYKQPDAMDSLRGCLWRCGPTCLRMVAKHHGRSISLQKLRSNSETTRAGSSLKGISEAAEKIGFRTLGVKVDFNNLVENAPLPCIVFWNERHFNFVACFAGVVVYKIKTDKVYIADPAHGLLTYSKREFLDNWIGPTATETTEEGIAIAIHYSIFNKSFIGISNPSLIENKTSNVTENLAFSIRWMVIFATLAISASCCWLMFCSSRNLRRCIPNFTIPSRFFTIQKSGCKKIFRKHICIQNVFIYLQLLTQKKEML